ncbi:hypothetical protein [Domibacillus epiphyticus]|uniref:Uncharacterized protein n=1 Tax=Domibacillus epiphyticus TaxID=1714355 RepID=A0A1V2ABV0_9BACI|nr:hypothetical protein [Domibacillus epiphyticus]OMP68440.1 hypothetical protein BTO28_02125 [Domibacillus epiphyticus]
MLVVCANHVKDGLKNFDVPHVKKVKSDKSPCSFCHKKADIKIFGSIPSFKEKRRIEKYERKKLQIQGV